MTLDTMEAVGRAVVRCERCSRLRTYCRQVAKEKKREFREWTYWGKPVPGFGDPEARLFIVGLAPAAHGGNRTGRVFTGDSSGDWLYEALHHFGFANQPTSKSREDGLELIDCYIAAAARCAPPGNKPTPREFENCRPYLEAETRILQRTKVVLVLGRLAHERWLRAAELWKPGRPDFSHGAEAKLPGDRILLSSYHPSRQNTNTGKLSREMWHGVFRRAREIVES